MSSFTPIPPPPGDLQQLDSWLGSFTNWEKQTPLSSQRRALGPTRCRNLLQRANLETPTGPVIQVAGTKGKGSTILWMEALLRQRGLPTAATLSPHLNSIEERIRIDGSELPVPALLDGLTNLHPHLVDPADFENSLPTFFDLWIALFIERAKNAGDRWILLEVGMGGPLDSTSALQHDVGVLTTVDLDHRAILGNTIAEIAKEKAAIATRKKPFILAAGDHTPHALEVAILRGAKPLVVDNDERIPTSIGLPQRLNGACALAALESIPETPPWSRQEVQLATQALQLPARLELIPGPPSLLIDGAHTPLSLKAFIDRFKTHRGTHRGSILIGMLADKEIHESLSWLTTLDPSPQILTVTPPTPRGLEATELSKVLSQLGLESNPVDSIEDALSWLKRKAATGEPVAATGSMHMAGMIRQHWIYG
ncbi:MAG: Mur ligase family protein [Planctomycetota bacterium]